MARVIALLRGVNVGGHNKIKMETLRALCDSLGCTNTQTYVQSGNVVFSTSKRNLSSLSSEIESAIESELGFRPSVMLRIASELREVVARNPFPAEAATDPAHLAVFFLSDPITAAAQAGIKALPPHPERIHLGGREFYVYFPNGLGTSKLPALIDRALKAPATARNWNTVTKLLEIADSVG
jgi:uncharacterized protein (DUF1697 family)